MPASDPWSSIYSRAVSLKDAPVTDPRVQRLLDDVRALIMAGKHTAREAGPALSAMYPICHKAGLVKLPVAPAHRRLYQEDQNHPKEKE